MDRLEDDVTTAKKKDGNSKPQNETGIVASYGFFRFEVCKRLNRS